MTFLDRLFWSIGVATVACWAIIGLAVIAALVESWAERRQADDELDEEWRRLLEEDAR